MHKFFSAYFNLKIFHLYIHFKAHARVVFQTFKTYLLKLTFNFRPLPPVMTSLEFFTKENLVIF